MTVDPAPLQLTVTHLGPTTIGVTVTGELDAVTAGALHTWILDTVTRHRPHAITLDLSRLQFIDAAGVRTLYRLHALTAAGGCALTIGTAHQVFWWTLSRLGLEPSFAHRSEPPADENAAAMPSGRVNPATRGRSPAARHRAAPPRTPTT